MPLTKPATVVLGRLKSCINHFSTTASSFDVIGEVETNNFGSLNHAKALNIGIHKLETKYALICDVDTVCLMRNWDSVLVDFLESSVASIIGSPYPPWQKQYQKFPNVTFSMFDVKVLQKLNPDFTPEFKGRRVIRRLISKEEKPYYSIRGGIIKSDTGWVLPRIYKQNGYDGIPFDVRMSIPSNKNGLPLCQKYYKHVFHNKLLSQHEYLFNGQVIASHLGTSREKSRKHISTSVWRRRVIQYMKDRNANFVFG